MTFKNSSIFKNMYIRDDKYIFHQIYDDQKKYEYSKFSYRLPLFDVICDFETNEINDDFKHISVEDIFIFDYKTNTF